jgi:ribonuclease HI
MLIAYTDGSTWKTNPGPMAWSVIYVSNNEIVKESSGALYTGTNNRAELLAVMWAISLEKTVDLVVRTDSTLVLNIATGLWQPKTNVDLWERFYESLNWREKRGLATQFQYVKGHGQDPFNRRADWLAREAAKRAAECITYGEAS